MTDLLERLRTFDTKTHDAVAICEEAADAIELMRETAVPRDEYELLRAETKKLRSESQAEMISDQFKIGQRDEEINLLRAETKKLRNECSESLAEMISDQFKIGQRDEEINLLRDEVDRLREVLRVVTNHFAAVMGGPLITGNGVTFENGVEGIPTIARARAVLGESK